MKIGVPKEIKNHEYRVAMTPAGVRELVNLGHEVHVQESAGGGAGFSDDDYRTAGAVLVFWANEIFDQCDIIVKVKEPQPSEVAMLRPNQILFTYLHLASDQQLTQSLIASGATAIAYETVTDGHSLPLLAPMSEVAGRLSVQLGANYLLKANGGLGTLLGGVPGVSPAAVTIIGGGIVGVNAAKMALGLGAFVTIIDKSLPRLRQLDDMFQQQRLMTLFATTSTIEDFVMVSDLVIGAVLIPGAAAPKLVTAPMIASMRKGCVVVDVAIDQGGCFETSKPTSHDNPTYDVNGVIHYCVTNMPGAVPKTSTIALTNATLPYVIELANKGYQTSQYSAMLKTGVNVHGYSCTTLPVAQGFGLPCKSLM